MQDSQIANSYAAQEQLLLSDAQLAPVGTSRGDEDDRVAAKSQTVVVPTVLNKSFGVQLDRNAFQPQNDVTQLLRSPSTSSDRTTKNSPPLTTLIHPLHPAYPSHPAHPSYSVPSAHLSSSVHPAYPSHPVHPSSYVPSLFPHRSIHNGLNSAATTVAAAVVGGHWSQDAISPPRKQAAKRMGVGMGIGMEAAKRMGMEMEAAQLPSLPFHQLQEESSWTKQCNQQSSNQQHNIQQNSNQQQQQQNSNQQQQQRTSSAFLEQVHSVVDSVELPRVQLQGGTIGPSDRSSEESRRWGYEVRRRDAELDIEVKSKKETHKNEVPKELYCTYIYKLCVRVKHTQPKKPFSLLAFIQILNGNTLEEVKKDGSAIIEGKNFVQIENSDYFLFRMKFTETSYHLNRLRFLMRISIYQRSFSTLEHYRPPIVEDPLLVPTSLQFAAHIPNSQPHIPNSQTQTHLFNEDKLSSNFIYEFNGHVECLPVNQDGPIGYADTELLACALSPLFSVYSKKNHTKKAQREARIAAQLKHERHLRIHQESSNSSSDSSCDSGNDDDNESEKRIAYGNKKRPIAGEDSSNPRVNQSRSIRLSPNSGTPPRKVTPTTKRRRVQQRVE